MLGKISCASENSKDQSERPLHHFELKTDSKYNVHVCVCLLCAATFFDSPSLHFVVVINARP